MNKLYILLIPLTVTIITTGCNKNNSVLSTPSNVNNIRVKADTGGVIISWNTPSNPNYLYVNVSYKKYPVVPLSSDSNKVISTQGSIYSDSVHIDGLLHKYSYKFKIQTFNANNEGKKGGKIFTVGPVTPIRRSVKTIYFSNLDSLIMLNVNAGMITQYTKYSVGAQKNLFDNDISTVWQTAWHGPTFAPLPHWLQIDFKKKVAMGAITYYLGQNDDPRPDPKQIGLEISKDRKNWKRVWTSEPDLPNSPRSKQFEVAFDKNYTSKHFRIMFVHTVNDASQWVKLDEMRFYKMTVSKVDLEKIAEQNY